jgi:hypothetical protein
MDDGMSQQLAERLRDDPVLADFLSPFPRLAEPEQGDLARTFERLAETVGSSKVRGRVQFRVLEGDGETVRSWSLELGPDACLVITESAHRPDLDVLVEERTWWRLVGGDVSPLEAFAQGGMRVRGDIQVARRLVRQLQQR